MGKSICPHCGNLIEDQDALMCLYCGEDLNRPVGFLGRIRYSSHLALAAFVTALVLGLIIVFLTSAASAEHADLAGTRYSSSPEGSLNDRDNIGPPWRMRFEKTRV